MEKSGFLIITTYAKIVRKLDLCNRLSALSRGPRSQERSCFRRSSGLFLIMSKLQEVKMTATKARIEILTDKQALVKRSLELILSKIDTAISSRGIFTIALSGGSTPKPLYEAMAKQNLPWDKIHVFWGDERYVAPTHPDSNELMARQAWLDKVDIPAQNIHAIPTLEGNPQISAANHQQHLLEFFNIAPGNITPETFPSLDVTLLGMGDDAHTASLFPHTEALKITDKLVTVGNKDTSLRITFTYPFINASRCVIFLVAGASKQPALASVFAPEADNFAYPSRFIKPQEELWWLLDESAGEEMK
jgi:6-phosphogluconolactonase